MKLTTLPSWRWRTQAIRLLSGLALVGGILPLRLASPMPVMAAAAHRADNGGSYRSLQPNALHATGHRTTRAPRVASTCNSQFSTVAGANPGLTVNLIMNQGLADLSASDIWAVGFQSDSPTAASDSTLAEQWNGSTWTAIASPNPGTGGFNEFWSDTVIPGASTDANNVWASGVSLDSSGVAHTLAAQYTGSGWNVPTTVDVGSGNNRLAAIKAFVPTAPATANIWAVGSSRPDNTTANNLLPLIEHYDGSSWTVSAAAAAPLGNGRFYAIAGTSGSDIWAIGAQGSSTYTTLIEHYDGTSWTVATSANHGPFDNVLYGGFAVSGTNVWAVGYWVDAVGAEHTFTQQWNGTSWSEVASPSPGAGTYLGDLFSITGTSANDLWAAGAVYAPNSNRSPSDTLVEHWNGTAWTIVPTPDGQSGQFNELNAILETSATNVWSAGDFDNTNAGQNQTLFENLCMSIPTVTGVVPFSGNSSGGTSVAISGTDFNFASGVSIGGSAATSFTVNSNTSITATVPAAAGPGAVDVTVTNPAGTSTTSTADTFVYVPPAVSWKQYTLTGNNGSQWVPIDANALSLSFTPPTGTADAILSGNADLWTSLAGVNQDLGIFMSGGIYGSGMLVGWKESGGFAGTFSPNAAFVQTVEPVVAGTTYTVTLEWKANHATSGTIYTAAGAGAPFSPTRLTAELIPSTTDLRSAVSTAQYKLIGSDGSTWQDMDATNLAIVNYTPSTTGTALISVNADLWTQNAGVNQDVGIFVSGGGLNGIVGWKESGGNAGTFSPNAAFAQATVTLAASTQYTIKVQWKANHATSGTIRAAAGAGPTVFSPTRLTLHLFAAGTGIQDAVSTLQYHKAGSTGTDWTPIDGGTGLTLNVTPGADSIWALEGNADLWTANAGVNQDIGIFVSGGAYGSNRLVAWKESGGFAGTFSPNAAFVQTVVPLQSGVAYTITLEWKANHATSGTIYAAAGAGPTFSPTRLTARQIG